MGGFACTAIRLVMRYNDNWREFLMSMEVTVVDDSDATGWLAAATRTGEIYMTDVASMVSNVISLLTTESETMSRLNILDHGSPRGFQVGTDNVNSGTLPTHSIELVKLRPHFATDGFVHLQHCQIGQNSQLLIALAQLLDVPVYAGKQYQNPIYRLNVGGTRHEGWLTGRIKVIPNPFNSFEEYVRADPDGTFHEDVGRP